jgi:ATP-dependent protease ClpP protease subunit
MENWTAQKEESSEDKSKNSTKADSLSGEGNSLERVNNRLYFYSEVSRDKILQMNKSIRELNNDLTREKNKFDLNESLRIYLHISSYGGSIFAGMAAVDEILKSKVPITSVIDGCAASAATLISVVAQHRTINKHAYMLVHQLSSVAWGKYGEIKDEVKNLDRFMKMIKDIYREYTKLPLKQLDEILKHDLWWDAKTCLKYGLVDEII